MEEQSVPGLKASNYRLTLVSSGNSSFKTGLLIYYSELPRTLQNYSKSTLPMSVSGTAKPDDSTSADNMVY